MEESAVTVDARVHASDAADHADATGVAGSERSGKARSGGSKLSDEQIEYFQSLLLAERARLEEEREQIRSRSGAVDGALPEEGEGGDEDTADLAAAMMDKEMDLSVEDEIEDLLAAVDHALQKMEDGTYGVCDMAGETIPASRLELIPWAALCVECQALAEGE
jgi:DnaK suppressor protein